MPVHQATPGPSTGIIFQHHQTNARKRSISEADNDSYNRGKRAKQDEENTVAKDKSKKTRARKKKRKQSITMAPMSPRSKSRSAPATQQKPSSLPDTPSSVPPNSQAADNDLTEMKAVEDTTPDVPHKEKGKGKARESHEDPQPPEASPETSTSIESPQSKMARLTKELETTTTLLQKHQAHLSQMHHSLTCQICLDLLHKPFALAPCGHVVCHGCLVRWFTATADDVPGPARSHIHKKKTCPICRSVVSERPAEIWTIKGMVGGLVRSALVELPVPPPAMAVDDVPTHAIDGNPDPWRNIFRPVRRHNGMPFVLPRLEEQDGGGGLEAMGMYDAEDGGIYRCIECMNEIWDGVCTGCQRIYPGHQVEDDGEDVDLSGDDDDSLVGRRRDRRILRDLVGMFADDQGELDADEFESWDGESLDDDEQQDILDHIPWEEQARYRQMGMAQMFGPPPPIVGGMHGMEFADFTDDGEEEGGIAMIEEATDDEGEVGYESSFIDDDSIMRRGPRIREVIELSDSEDGDDGPARMRWSMSARQRMRAPDSDPTDVEEDEEDGGVTVEEFARIIGGRTRMRAPVVYEDEDEWSGSASEVRVAGRRRNAGPVVIESDEEHEVRRSGRNRGGRP